MSDSQETPYDRYVQKALYIKMISSNLTGQDFDENEYLKQLPDPNRREKIIVDLTSGAIIRKGNEAEIEVTFSEWLALREMDSIDRMDAILDILDSLSPEADSIIYNDLYEGDNK